MTNAIQELKAGAEIPHKQSNANEPVAIGRLRKPRVGVAVPYHNATTGYYDAARSCCVRGGKPHVYNLDRYGS